MALLTENVETVTITAPEEYSQRNAVAGLTGAVKLPKSAC